MAQHAGRVTCPRCGANNFDTVTSCWKCGTPMGAGASVVAPIAPAAAQGYVERVVQPVAYAPAAIASPAGDSRVARRAAIALALTIPWIGLPVGWIFMMIEDSRKQAIGRVCAVWSMIALVLHLILMVWMTQATMSFLQTYALPFLKGYTRGAQSGGSEGSGGLTP